MESHPFPCVFFAFVFYPLFPVFRSARVRALSVHVCLCAHMCAYVRKYENITEYMRIYENV